MFDVVCFFIVAIYTCNVCVTERNCCWTQLLIV